MVNLDRFRVVSFDRFYMVILIRFFMVRFKRFKVVNFTVFSSRRPEWILEFRDLDFPIIRPFFRGLLFLYYLCSPNYSAAFRSQAISPGGWGRFRLANDAEGGDRDGRQRKNDESTWQAQILSIT